MFANTFSPPPPPPSVPTPQRMKKTSQKLGEKEQKVQKT
jgi:hypothetical protein